MTLFTVLIVFLDRVVLGLQTKIWVPISQNITANFGAVVAYVAVEAAYVGAATAYVRAEQE